MQVNLFRKRQESAQIEHNSMVHHGRLDQERPRPQLQHSSMHVNGSPHTDVEPNIKDSIANANVGYNAKPRHRDLLFDAAQDAARRADRARRRRKRDVRRQDQYGIEAARVEKEARTEARLDIDGAKHPDDSAQLIAIPSTAQDDWGASIRHDEEALANEQSLFNDLIRSASPDVYRNLPLKLKSGYEWAAQNTDAEWFVKTDDDSVLRVATLEHYLRTSFSPQGPVGIGFICENCSAPFTGKWSDFEYKYDATQQDAFAEWVRNTSYHGRAHRVLKSRKYPPFPLGSYGHVVSRPVAEYVVRHQQSLYDYQGEDISLGIWIDESPLNESMRWITSEHVTNDGNCENSSFWMAGHKISPQSMKQCHEHADESASLNAIVLPRRWLPCMDIGDDMLYGVGGWEQSVFLELVRLAELDPTVSSYGNFEQHGISSGTHAVNGGERGIKGGKGGKVWIDFKEEGVGSSGGSSGKSTRMIIKSQQQQQQQHEEQQEQDGSVPGADIKKAMGVNNSRGNVTHPPSTSNHDHDSNDSTLALKSGETLVPNSTSNSTSNSTFNSTTKDGGEEEEDEDEVAPVGVRFWEGSYLRTIRTRMHTRALIELKMKLAITDLANSNDLQHLHLAGGQRCKARLQLSPSNYSKLPWAVALNMLGIASLPHSAEGIAQINHVIGQLTGLQVGSLFNSSHLGVPSHWNADKRSMVALHTHAADWSARKRTNSDPIEDREENIDRASRIPPASGSQFAEDQASLRAEHVQPCAVGDSVEARWDGDEWYDATICEIHIAARGGGGLEDGQSTITLDWVDPEGTEDYRILPIEDVAKNGIECSKLARNSNIHTHGNQGLVNAATAGRKDENDGILQQIKGWTLSWWPSVEEEDADEVEQEGGGFAEEEEDAEEEEEEEEEEGGGGNQEEDEKEKKAADATLAPLGAASPPPLPTQQDGETVADAMTADAYAAATFKDDAMVTMSHTMISKQIDIVPQRRMLQTLKTEKDPRRGKVYKEKNIRELLLRGRMRDKIRPIRTSRNPTSNTDKERLSWQGVVVALDTHPVETVVAWATARGTIEKLWADTNKTLSPEFDLITHLKAALKPIVEYYNLFYSYWTKQARFGARPVQIISFQSIIKASAMQNQTAVQRGAGGGDVDDSGAVGGRDGDGGDGGGGDAQDNYMQLVADNEMNHLASVEISRLVQMMHATVGYKIQRPEHGDSLLSTLSCCPMQNAMPLDSLPARKGTQLPEKVTEWLRESTAVAAADMRQAWTEQVLRLGSDVPNLSLQCRL